ncbi:MAG: T9SS type A sorting domain-containing protein [Bacteroidetes bacterium]|nr:T9SS type A sorting domain-containing protein [Bacteroidota bacterium]
MKHIKLLLILFLSFSYIMDLKAQGSWTRKANFIGGPRTRAVKFSIANQIYYGTGNVVGGNAESSDFYKYDISTDSWTQVASLPKGMQAGVGFSIGTKGYAGMGWLSGNAFVDFYEYDPSSNTWITRASWPGPLTNDANSFVVNGKAYVGGGDGPYGNPTISNFYQFDPLLNSWSQKADIPAPGRRSSGTFSIGNFGYMGVGSNDDLGVSLSDYYKYDPLNNSWSAIADFPFASTSSRNCAFTINGYGYSTNYLNLGQIYKYDPVANTWSQIISPSYINFIADMAEVVNEKAYFARGASNEFWEWDPNGIANCMVAFYPFTGNAADSSGLSNNGVVNGASLSTDRFGNANSAYYFNGLGDYINAGDVSYLDGLSEATWSWWMSTTDPQPRPSANDYISVIRKDSSWIPLQFANDGYDYWRSILFTGGLGSANLVWGSGASNVIPYNGDWNMYAVVKTPTEFKYYKNGVFQQSIAYTGQLENRDAPLLFGRAYTHNSLESYNGKLDEIRIYSCALSDSEIIGLYSECGVPIVFNLQDSISSCGSSATLDAGSGFDTYTWNTGSTSQIISAEQSGWNVCTVSIGACTAKDSTFLDLKNVDILNNDTSICSGSSVTLSAIASGFETEAPCELTHLPLNLQQGLAAWYPFCGNAIDASVTENHATVFGPTLSNDRYGNSQSAYQFDGMMSRISAPNNPSINIYGSQQASTISFWFKIENTDSTYNLIHRGYVSQDASLGNNYLAVEYHGVNQIHSHRLIFTLYNFSTLNDVYSLPNLIQANTWYNVTIIRDQNSSIFLNGLDVSETVINSGWSTDYNSSVSLTGLNFGSQSGRSSASNFYYLFPLKGALDNVMLYNRALSISEIAQLYNERVLSYLWSTGETTSSIQVTPSLTSVYTITATDGLSSCTANVTVTVNDATSSVTQENSCTPYTWNGQSYTQTGTYSFQTTNSAGCDSIATLNLTIRQPSASSETVLACNSYMWNGQTYNQSGSYTYSTTNIEGCDSIATIHLTINSSSTNPSSIGISTNNVSAGTPVLLTVIGGALGTGADWKWYTGSCGGVPAGSGSALTVAPQASTTYFVRAEGTCNITACISVTVTVIPLSNCLPPTSILSTAGMSVCANSMTTLSVVGGLLPSGSRWRWYKSGCGIGTSVGTGSSLTVNISCTTTYYVRGEGGSCGPTGCASITLQVLPRPSLPGSIAGQTFGLCNASGKIYSVASVSGASSYQWSVSSGITILSGQGTNAIVVSFSSSCSNAGTISVRAINACGSSPSRCLYVSTLPSAPSGITGSSSVCRNQTYSYSCSTVVGATYYFWSVPQGATILTGQGTTSISLQMSNRSGQVSVKARNSCGYSSSRSKTLSISCREIVELPITNDQVAVYPNPSSSSVNLKYRMSEQGKVLINVLDLTGRVLFQITTVNEKEGDYTLELPFRENGLAPGIYMLHLIRNEQQDVIRVALSY